MPQVTQSSETLKNGSAHSANGAFAANKDDKGSFDGTQKADAVESSSSSAAAAFRSVNGAAIGEICLLMLMLPRYRYLHLQDMEWLILAPLLKNKLAVARIAPKSGGEKKLVGGVLWASVSSDVDGKIRAQIKQGIFPIRLRPEDWASGDITWVLDVLAPTEPLATKIFSEIGRAGLGGARKLNAHPIVQQLVDSKLLQAMGAKIEQSQSPEKSETPENQPS